MGLFVASAGRLFRTFVVSAERLRNVGLLSPSLHETCDCIRYVGSLYPPFYVRSLSTPLLRGDLSRLRYGTLVAFVT